MTAKLTIALSDDVLAALRASKTITISLASGTGSKSIPPAGGLVAPREGSLSARVLDWAEKRGTSFRNTDVEKKFKLSRAHASMITSKLAASGHRIRRKARGVYEYTP